jgi:hypothetical protein
MVEEREPSVAEFLDAYERLHDGERADPEYKSSA